MGYGSMVHHGASGDSRQVPPPSCDPGEGSERSERKRKAAVAQRRGRRAGGEGTRAPASLCIVHATCVSIRMYVYIYIYIYACIYMCCLWLNERPKRRDFGIFHKIVVRIEPKEPFEDRDLLSGIGPAFWQGMLEVS